MKLTLRATLAIAVASMGLLACAQIIGIADTKDRVSVAPGDGNDAGDSGDIDTNRPGQDAGDAGIPCEHNAQCIEYFKNKPALCVEKQCVPISPPENSDLCLSQAYPIVAPNKTGTDGLARMKDDNVFVIPAFLSHNLSSNDPALLAYNLALTELVNGIGSSPPRPVAMIICSADEQFAPAAVQHVVNDLKLPALLAGFGADQLTNYVRQYARPKGVFVLNPSVAPQALKYDTDEQSRLLFWSLLGPTEDVALAYHPLVEFIRPYVNKKVVDAGRTDMKVAVVYTQTPGEKAADTVVEMGSFDGTSFDVSKAIVVNGKSPANADGGFVAVSFPGTEQADRYVVPQGTIDAIVNFGPDIVIALTAGELRNLVRGVENGLEDDGGAGPFEETNARRARFLGIQYASTRTVATPDERQVYTEWLGHMDQAWKATVPAGTDYTAAENFYDAVYWLAYGLYAGHNNAAGITDSAALAQGVRLLIKQDATGADVIKPGPDHIEPAFARLRDVNKEINVKFVGALGPPNFNTRFGTWNSIGATYCYPDHETVAVPTPKYDTQRYNPDTGKLDDVLDNDQNPTICRSY